MPATGSDWQPQQAGSRTGRFTAGRARGGPGDTPGLAICLPVDSLELAWALERRLFDQGYVVHVIREAASFGQAVRTAVEAGLIAIVAPSTTAEAETVRSAVPASRLASVQTAEDDPESAAREIVLRLEASGRLGRSQGPLTGGAGI